MPPVDLNKIWGRKGKNKPPEGQGEPAPDGGAAGSGGSGAPPKPPIETAPGPPGDPDDPRHKHAEAKPDPGQDQPQRGPPQPGEPPGDAGPPPPQQRGGDPPGQAEGQTPPNATTTSADGGDPAGAVPARAPDEISDPTGAAIENALARAKRDAEEIVDTAQESALARDASSAPGGRADAPPTGVGEIGPGGEGEPAQENALAREAGGGADDDVDFDGFGADEPLARGLRAAGVVGGEALANAKRVLAQSPGKRLAELLFEQGADEAEVQAVVARLAGLTFERVDLERGLDGGFDGASLQRLGVDFCKQHLALPLRTEGSRLIVGATRADDIFVLDEVKQRLGVASVKLVLVTPFDVRAALDVVGGGADEEVDLSEILDEVEEGDVEVAQKSESDAVDLEAKAGESPVIRYVNYIIQTAVKEGASDIHIEPGEKKLRVRFRIDGVLFEMMNPPASMSAAITSRLKIMAGLDISERRLPQDGRIRCVVQGRKLDLRMSTLPSAGGGEKTVMRILDTRSINVKLEDLGFDPNTLDVWRREVTAPHGIVLVTGPTGSGKTTTLYSSLRQLDKNKLNISTVEDPVEYHLDGITQTQMHEKIGMTFAKALKALLRQDPDVIMLGEIRDHETAHTAIQAALTGHLVLSTLHTNDAPSSMTRLVNIGLEPFLVGAAVNAVLAQRLVRRLCQSCRELGPATGEMAEFMQMQGLDPSAAWSAPGCPKCRNTGYSGRVGIYELLAVDDHLRDVIARNPNVSEFRRMCIERGMVTLRQDGMRKAAEGLTSVREVLRVTEASL